jgi:hypothetical protein
MLRAEPRLRACTSEGWGTDVSLGISVAPSGQVRQAEVLGPLAQQPTGRCLLMRLRALRFPPFTEPADRQFFWSLHLPDP